MTSERILGIHHMTAITDDAQANIDFYTGVLGLRLVKLTVNFDDPTAYHLYYGDGLGTPGSALTFFPYPGRQGRVGAGQVTSTALAIPADSTGWWLKRLESEGVQHSLPFTREDEEVIPFTAHDGLPLELIASPSYSPGVPIDGGTVPHEKSISRMHSVTITENYGDATVKLLEEVMGFKRIGEFGNRIRFAGYRQGPGAYLDIIADPTMGQGHGGHGTVHHIAWATESDSTQMEWHKELGDLGYLISPIMNRDYFRSIYFREPGGVLFEIATLGPGMAIDEPQATLGTSLRLPQMYENMRSQIEAALPKLRLPNGVEVPIQVATPR
jgi:glyoxalase family protein